MVPTMYSPHSSSLLDKDSTLLCYSQCTTISFFLVQHHLSGCENVKLIHVEFIHLKLNKMSIEIYFKTTKKQEISYYLCILY